MRVSISLQFLLSLAKVGAQVLPLALSMQIWIFDVMTRHRLAGPTTRLSYIWQCVFARYDLRGLLKLMYVGVFLGHVNKRMIAQRAFIAQCTSRTGLSAIKSIFVSR